LLPLGGLFLVRRNLRLGRGDRTGSLRMALFVFTTYSCARLFHADHVAGFGAEFWLLIKVFAYPLAFASLMWIFYMAVEPYARRQWPRILISWGRLLTGRWRDPMVGRDVLLGATAGAFLHVLQGLSARAPSWLGEPQAASWWIGDPQSLSSWKLVPYGLFVNLHSAALWSVVHLFLLVLLRVLLRRKELALGAWGLLILSGNSGNVSNPGDWAIAVPLLLLYFISLVVLTRTGLLGYACMSFVAFVMVQIPLTFDASVLWAPRGWVVLAVILAIGIHGFYSSLAGKPIFGRDWLET
jgi:serine/threonine-protein kinase